MMGERLVAQEALFYSFSLHLRPFYSDMVPAMIASRRGRWRAGARRSRAIEPP